MPCQGSVQKPGSSAGVWGGLKSLALQPPGSEGSAWLLGFLVVSATSSASLIAVPRAVPGNLAGELVA